MISNTPYLGIVNSGNIANGSVTASDMANGGNEFSFRNRIINGDMRIDQRNAGASITPTGNTYTLDRWWATMSAASKFSIQQNAGAVTPPAGFTSYLGITSTSAYTAGATETFSIRQVLEGLNVADFGWGTANAATITLSFWVRSSLTGTFGGALYNSAANRWYAFSYTVSAANTWERETITIPGDTSGTWLTNNGVGIGLIFSLGAGATLSGTPGAWSSTTTASATGAVSVVGTNGATFYITGVQLEAGSVATPFERRDYGRELMMCQRYYQTGFAAGRMSFASTGGWPIQYKVSMRATPTITFGTPVVSFNLAGGPLADNPDVNGFTLRISGNSDYGWTGPYASAIEL